MSTEPLLLGYPWWGDPGSPCWHFHRLINACLVLYVFCLKMPYLIFIVDLLVLNSQPAALLLMPERNIPNIRIFSITHIPAFLHFGNETLQHYAWGHFKQQNQWKHKNAKKTNRLWKGLLFTVWELKPEGEYHLVWRQLEYACQLMQIFQCSEHFHKVWERAMTIDLR